MTNVVDLGWYGVGENHVTDLFVLPAQWADIWTGDERTREHGARACAWSVLFQAYTEARDVTWSDGAGSVQARRRQLAWDAFAWAWSDDVEWPYSFLNICAVLQLDPQAVRAQFASHQPGAVAVAGPRRRYLSVGRRYRLQVHA